MKQTSRKLLSLLMALAIVLSMLPGSAMAANGSGSTTYGDFSWLSSLDIDLSRDSASHMYGMQATFNSGYDAKDFTFHFVSSKPSVVGFGTREEFSSSADLRGDFARNGVRVVGVSAGTADITVSLASNGTSLGTLFTVPVSVTGTVASKATITATPNKTEYTSGDTISFSADFNGNASRYEWQIFKIVSGETLPASNTISSNTARATWVCDTVTERTRYFVNVTPVVNGTADRDLYGQFSFYVNPVAATPAKIDFSGSGVSNTNSVYSLSMTTARTATVTAAVQTADGTTIPGATITSVESNNTNICTVSNRGNTITVTPVAEGTTSVTVTYRTGADRIPATLYVTVEQAVANVTFTSTNTYNNTLTLQTSSSQDVTASVDRNVDYATVEWNVTSGSSYVSVEPFTGTTKANIRSGRESGTATVTATFKNSAGTTVAQGTLTVRVGTTTGTLPLTPSPVTVNYNQVATVTPTVTSWPTAYSIDWEITSGTTYAWISTSSSTASSSNWGYTAQTTLRNGVIPGIYVFGRSTGTATLTAVLKDYYGSVLARNTVNVNVNTGSHILTAYPSSVTVPYGSWSNGVRVSSSNRNGSYVVWSVPRNGYVTLSTNGTTNASNPYQVTTNLDRTSYTTPYVYLYRSNNSTTYNTTLTATLYDASNNRLDSIDIPVYVGNNGFTLSPSPSNTSAVYLNESWSSSSSNYYRTFSVTPLLNNANIPSGYRISYVWTLNGYPVQSYSTGAGYNERSYTLYANNQYLNSYYWNDSRYNTLKCTAYMTDDGTTASATNYDYTTEVSWNVYTGTTSQFSVSATIYDSNPGYALTDTPDGTTTSIADQIDNWVRNNYYYGTSSSYYRNYQVRVTGGTRNESGSSSTSGNYGTLTSNSNWLSPSDLNKIVFTPGTTVSSASGSYQITFPFEVRFNDSYNNYNNASGTMVFTVRQGTATGGSITYSAQLGKDVTFSVADFENFWSNLYSRGSLSYVTFGSVSGGTVYNANGKSVGSTSYYANPSSSQSSLSGVYFSPNSATSKKAGTVSIPFTARGTTTSSNSSTATRSGTIVITYLAAAANTITYSTNVNGTASLKAQDFIDAYKKAVNTSSTPSNLTIVFQEVPSYGTLSYKNGSSTTKLTSSNVKNRSFNAKTSGSNQLGDVTYTASGSRTETIGYIGYIGSTATFTGDVTFNAAAVAPTDVRVTLPTCYSAAGVAMNLSYFTGANAALTNASYISFGTPRTGKLSSTTYGSTTVSTAMLSGVTYVPAASPTSTTDSFTFSAYNASGTVVASGTVSVVVSLPTNPNAITNINQFTDIPAAGPQSDWYRPQLTYLINKGVINGTGNGKFGPEDALTYGAALKMIMNAAGYYEAEADENQAGVSDWAQNYKSTAVQKGWMSNSVNLKATISRDNMAELTAKVLGISPVTNQTSPFADSTNAYAIALYNNKIVQGELWDDGSRHFTPTKALTRNEMVCLVYNMYQFTGK